MENITSIPQFEQAIENNPEVLVEFYASWCPHCQHFAPILAEAASDLTIPTIRVEIDQNPELTGYYQVNDIPTLILFENGEPVARNVGVISAQQVLEFVQQNS